MREGVPPVAENLRDLYNEARICAMYFSVREITLSEEMQEMVGKLMTFTPFPEQPLRNFVERATSLTGLQKNQIFAIVQKETEDTAVIPPAEHIPGDVMAPVDRPLTMTPKVTCRYIHTVSISPT